MNAPRTATGDLDAGHRDHEVDPGPKLPVDLPEPVRRRLGPVERYGARLTLAGLAIVLVAVPFSSLLFNVIAEGPVTRVDGDLADRMNDWVHQRPGLTGTLEWVSWLGRPPLLAVWVIATAVWCWRGQRHRLAVFVVVTTLGGGIVDTLVKMAVDRPRPVVDHPIVTAFGKSFPSGHAMSSLVTYGAITLLVVPAVSRRWRAPLVVGAVLVVLAVGLSRLLLGVHFLSDVVGGYLLGAAWLAAATAVFEAWRHDLGPQDPVEEDELATSAPA